MPPSTSAVPPDLAALLAACALRDQQAFAELYRHSSANLFAIALRIVSERSLAEEVLQETFIKIWQHAGDYRTQRGQPMTWLASIARYQALDVLRRQKRQPQASGAEDVEQLPTAVAGLTADDDTLQRCLARLEEAQRQCVLLAYCEGYSHQELSERLTTPIGTVKSWIRRSLQRLKGCFRELS